MLQGIIALSFSETHAEHIITSSSSSGKSKSMSSRTLNAYLHVTDNATERLLRGEKTSRREYISRSAGNITAFDRAFKSASYK